MEVCNFVSPVVGIADEGNAVPHSFMFLPLQQEWPDFLSTGCNVCCWNKDDNVMLPIMMILMDKQR